MTTTTTRPAEGPPSPRGRGNRLLLRTARRGGPWAVVLALAALTDAAATVALPAVLSRAVDAVITSGTAGSAAGSATGNTAGGPAHDVAGGATGEAVLLFTAIVVIAAVADVLTELSTGATAARATAWVRRLLVGHVLACGPAFRQGSGDLAGRVVSGAADAGIAPAAMITVVVSGVPPLGAITALILIDWRIAATLALAMPLIALLLRAFVRDTTDVTHRYLTVQGRIASRLATALRGSRTIAAAGTSRHETERVLSELPELRADGYAMWRTQGQIGARGLITVLLLQVAVLTVAGLELGAGRISTGQLIAAVQYAGLATGLGPVITQLSRLARARAAIRRTAEILAVPAPLYGADRLPRSPDRPNGPDGPDGATGATGPTGPVGPTGHGTLEFRGVRVEGVFDGLDLTVPGGLAVAVVGRSGSGASMLAALAGRLRDPDQGEVLLDGMPLPRLGRRELRENVSYAFARPALFGETLGEAIAFGARELSGERVRAAAVSACADPFIRRLPGGYDTPLRDAPMSGGELQRTGLARAFAHDGRLLILDDATSSLDTATEVEVTRAVFGAFTGRTRLVIAQRAATAARADLVVWLDGGRVRARAAHHMLWADPEYRAVFGVDGT